MRCDVCKEHPAQMHVRMQLNGNKHEFHVCSECYAKMGQANSAPIASGPFSPFSSLSGMDDFFASLAAANAPFGPSQANMHSAAQPQSGRGGGLLDGFGRNLTDWARQGRIDPVIGREKEVSRVIEILNRRNKNNPVLIGEPGVGKTAIAEGLALRIVDGQVPSKLRDKQIYTLDVSSLVADTGIRGQFEQRMNALIAELEARPEVVLFIDEIHLLVGAGSAQGSMDAGNILKPVLARGEIQVIGATTLKEYRQIEKDAALERRFQPVMVDEPTAQEAIEILRGLKPKYEAYHKVRYSDEAIAACVTLSKRYIGDRFLPDKAIDLMDEAGSKANLKLVHDEPDDLNARLAHIIHEKDEATRVEAYERAAELRKEEMRVRQLLSERHTEREALSNAIEVSIQDIEAIVEDKTGIPVRKMEAAEQAKLQHLEEELSAHVIGQSEAVKKVAKAVRRSRAGLRKGDRPIGSFLFVGPTGVGKTELAKSLAQSLFGSKDAMIRLDMSEYMEKHSVSKLIGSPPGYVGYEDAGGLTERVRRNGYSLILLDEIEKAHPDVQHMFLQIMEDGRLTDSQGRTVSFKDTMIIMTSNAGVAERKGNLGFRADDSEGGSAGFDVRIGDLSGYFKPEFLNRFDAIVEFNALSEQDVTRIVDLFLDELKGLLKEQGIDLAWTPEAVNTLGRRGYDPKFGARPLRRVIQEVVEDQIADVLVDQGGASRLMIDIDDDESIVIRVAEAVK